MSTLISQPTADGNVNRSAHVRTLLVTTELPTKEIALRSNCSLSLVWKVKLQMGQRERARQVHAQLSKLEHRVRTCEVQLAHVLRVLQVGKPQ
jgi:hypothetical protein